MARKRMVDPNIWESEDFSKLSVLSRLLFIGLFSNADDEGKGKGKAVYLKSIIFSYDENMRISDIERALDEIAEHMSIVFYKEGGNEYYELINFLKWQRVDKPRKSVIPSCSEQSEILRGTFLSNKSKGKRSEKKKTGKEPGARGEHQNVLLSGGEFEKLEAFCGGADQRDEYIERLSGWLRQIGPDKAERYVSHYATITNWVRRDQEKNPKIMDETEKTADDESLLRVKRYQKKKEQLETDTGF